MRRRRLSLLCAAALAATGTATIAPATAAPAAPAAGASSSDAAAVPGELLVGYVVGADEGARSRARARAEARLAERVVAGGADRAEVERVHLPQDKSREQAIAELRSDPAVAYAEPNWIYTHAAKPGSGGGTVRDYFEDGSLWGMYGEASSRANAFGSQAAEAWTTSTGSHQVVVGVIDEGIQHTHPDLDANVFNPTESSNGGDDDGNGYVDDVHGWDFVNNDNTIYDGGTRGDLDDHGTHVSGTIGAESGAELGVKGVNHTVTMISGKFLGRRGGTLANAVKAVDYITDLKANRGLKVVATNNSWGGGGYSQALLDAITRGAKADILFIAAAGNSGGDNDTTASHPSNYDTTTGTDTESAATYDAVIAVAAIDKLGELASFSQYGAKTVDLGAPGVDVWSTTAFNTYSSYNGTSMATPHVTGGAALYVATHPTASAAQVKAALLQSTVPTASLAGKTVTGGRLDANGALTQ